MGRNEYFNNMLVRLEELLFHELSGCAAWKTELVGIDFMQSKKIKGKTEEEIINHCIKEITDGGLVKDMAFSIGRKGILLNLKMKGCIHLPKEARLKKDGITPYVCPIANMVLDQLIEKLKYETTYLAQLDINQKTRECKVKTLTSGDFSSFLNTYKSSTYRSQVGIAWVILDYFRFRRLHFGNTISPPGAVVKRPLPYIHPGAYRHSPTQR
jgi:hypothetical protein